MLFKCANGILNRPGLDSGPQDDVKTGRFQDTPEMASKDKIGEDADSRRAENAEAPPDLLKQKAVALEYVAGEDAAPRVVAKGRGHLADMILELAFANGVKVRQDSDLVELLHAVELDHDIPVEAFAAVAEILAYVYRANQSWPQALAPQTPHRQAVPQGSGMPS